MHPGHVLKVATYNIHKGVRGVGPRKRLEIHNLVLGIEALDADVVFLQEVHAFHHEQARAFPSTVMGWPRMPQADYLAPEGYHAVYRTNAVTKYGEHGNAMLSRWDVHDEIGHHDVSDHRFEQRGLLHARVLWNGSTTVHAICAHLGLMHSSRVRQVERLAKYIEAHIAPGDLLVVAGDFNDWGEKLDAPMRDIGLMRAQCEGAPVLRTFPSRFPIFSLDRIYTRGLRCTGLTVPRGNIWARMSDHLPLVAELELA
jgi:endonuclease/exonuclease/phosphatase family metal-dependent hydrolase